MIKVLSLPFLLKIKLLAYRRKNLSKDLTDINTIKNILPNWALELN